MLTYAGIPLALPTEETAAWIRAHISPTDVYDFQRMAWPGKNLTGLPFSGTVRQRPVCPNTLYWPTGASRWAVGYFFATFNQLQQIYLRMNQNPQYVPFPLVMTTDGNDGNVINVPAPPLQPADIPIDNPGGAGRLVNNPANVPSAITTNLYLLPPRPLAQIWPATTHNQLYLLTLVDDRYFWWFRDTAKWLDGVTTWAGLFLGLSQALGLGTIITDPIPTAYLNPPQDIVSRYEYTPLILDAAAASIGQRLVRGLDGKVTCQGIATAAQAQGNFAKIAGGEFFTSGFSDELAGLIPRLVNVVFSLAKKANIVSCPPFTVGTLFTDLNIAALTPNVETKVFRDTAAAAYSAAGTLINQAELAALGKQIALDWYQWQLASLDMKFAGIVPYVPEGLSDSIEWTYRRNELSTRVQRPAFNDQTNELLHAGTYGSSSVVTESAPVRVANASNKVQLTASAAGGATSLTTAPLPVSLVSGQDLEFPLGVTAVLTSNASAGATSLAVQPLSGSIANSSFGTMPGYDGWLIGYNTNAQTWSDILPVWVIEKNGAALAQQNYDAELVGCDGGRPVYATVAGGGTATPLTVQNEDATQSVANVTTLKFKKKRRFTIISPVGNEADVELDIFWAKIGSHSPGDLNKYPWTEVTETTGGTFATLGGGRSGTVGTQPAYEVNGNLSVPNGAIVQMWRGFLSGSQEYLFETPFSGGTTPPFGAGGPLFLAQLTDYDASSHIYTWHEVIPTGQSIFATLGGGRSGGLAANPAFELNDNPRVPDLSIVVMYQGQAAISGSGLTLTLTTSGGAITAVAIGAAGSGYPISTTILVSILGAGTGGIAAVTTNGSGVPTSVTLVNSVASMGTGYVNATVATATLGQQYLFDGIAPPFFAKITGYSSGTNAYSFTEADTGDSAAHVTAWFNTRPGGRASSAAYEVTGNVKVPNNAVVLMWWGFYSATDQQEYLFYYPQEGVTVERSDGTQTVLDASDIQFDPPSLWTIAAVAGGKAKVTPAGLTSTQTIVTAVSCTAGTLSVTTKSFVWTDGFLVSVT